MKYICILRGINVGGKRKILMADLRDLFEGLGFSNIVTYIQSGNVIFDSKKKVSKTAENKISKAILDKYGFDVPSIVRSAKEIKTIHDNNPYLNGKADSADGLHLTFLAENPADAEIENIDVKDYAPDNFVIVENNIYVSCSGRYSDTKLNNTFFEKKLKVRATTRNWKTIQKLLDLST